MPVQKPETHRSTGACPLCYVNRPVDRPAFDAYRRAGGLTEAYEGTILIAG